MRLIDDIVLNEIVNKLDKNIYVSEVVDHIEQDGGEWLNKVRFCNEKWARLYFSPVFPTDIYDIQLPYKLQVGDPYELPLPLFFSGTPLVTVEEWSNWLRDVSNMETDKLPFIWLVTPTKTKWMAERMVIEREEQCTVFFVHTSDWTQKNEARLNYPIEPLHGIVNEFVDTINMNARVFNSVKQHSRTDLPRFGKETPKGIEMTIFKSTLAAVRLQMNLEIKKNCNC